MIIDHLVEGIPIPLDATSRICAAAFNGCNYYFLPCRECQIVKTDSCFIQLCAYATCKKYDCICYDLLLDCLWVAGRQCGNRIYKLDMNLREIDHLSMEGSLQGAITGISCNCCTGKLIISAGDSLFEVNKKSGRRKFLYCANDCQITGVLSLCPGYLLTTVQQRQQQLVVLDSCGDVIKTCWLQPDFRIQSILFNPCYRGSCMDCVEVFTLKKECYTYVYRIPLDQFALGYSPCDCNYRVCTHSTPCPQPKPNHGNGCADVLESIALVEAALAHILNAEGEKLQKVLAETNDIDKILCVNQSVNQSVVNVTHLEQVLYDKLNALKAHCPLECNCAPKPPCLPKSHCPPEPYCK